MGAKIAGHRGPTPFWLRLVGFVLGCLLTATMADAALPPAARTEIRIGVLAHRGTEKALLQWQATADYLNSRIPGDSFKVVPLDFQQIGPATRDNRIDFVIANPAIYVELESLYGATRIATLKKSGSGPVATQFGGVIFCRSDRKDLQNLADLKGKNFLAVDENSLGGWQMAWYEFFKQGIDPYKDFRSLAFAKTHDAVVFAVLDQKADAGTARSEVLENLAKKGKIDLAKLRVLNRQKNDSYHFLTSTPLYPEWPIARLKNTSDELSTAVVIALLDMPPDSMAARNAEAAGWTTPLDYTLVHTLLHDLRLGPYRDYGKVTWKNIWSNHRHLVVAGAILLLLVVLFAVVVVFLNRRLQLSHKASAQLGRKLDLILNSAGEGIFGLDDQGRHTFINAAGAAMLGYSPAELIGRPSHSTWHHTTRDGQPFPKETCPIYSVYRDGRSHAQLDDVFWRGDGTSFPVEYVCNPMVDNDKVIGAVVMFKDITLRKKMEQMAIEKNAELAAAHATLQESRTELQNALDQVANLLDRVIEKKDFSIRFENPNLQTCREVMDCDRKECPGHAMDNGRCWQVAGNYSDGGTKGVFVEQFGKCFKCPVYIRATTNPIYMIGESFNNMMHILEVQHLTLEKTYIDLQGAQTTILQQEKMASIGQLAAGVAHEINNPMGFISSNLGTLSKYLERLTEFIAAQSTALEHPKAAAGVIEARKKLKIDFVVDDTKELIKESLDGAERVKRIVQNLKSFSRVDQSEEQPADLNDCLETTLNIIWNELKYKTTIHKEYGELPRLRCFPQQLNQVFMNLLVNAGQAIEKQGDITIRTWAEPEAIKVAISDTGGGIPTDKLSRIFEPFFTTKPVGKGTGLGLSICYDIVKKHGGEILVESREGVGSTFTVVLPIKIGEETKIQP